MEARVDRFRKAVATYFGGRPGRGARYPENLQQEAVVLAQAGVLEGKSLGSVASDLGISCATLSRWLEGTREALEACGGAAGGGARRGVLAGLGRTVRLADRGSAPGGPS